MKNMKYSERILRKLLDKLIPGIQEVVKLLDSKLSDKEKLFQIRVAVWSSESDVQEELEAFVEKEIFTPKKVRELPQSAEKLKFKKHKVMNTMFLN